MRKQYVASFDCPSFIEKYFLYRGHSLTQGSKFSSCWYQLSCIHHLLVSFAVTTTTQQKMKCILWLIQLNSVICGQLKFKLMYIRPTPIYNSTNKWNRCLRETGAFSYSTVHNIIHKLKHSCHVYISRSCGSTSNQQTMTADRGVVRKYWWKLTVLIFSCSLFLFAEATSYLKCIMNRYNCRFWGSQPSLKKLVNIRGPCHTLTCDVAW
jgi:hypothetical protein